MTNFVTEPVVHKGLDGVVVDRTAISMINSDTSSLLYRGYPVQQLAASCSYEAVAHLIWEGELLDAAELARFSDAEKAHRSLDIPVLPALLGMPKDCHPMDVVRTAVSMLGAASPDDSDRVNAIRLMAALPTVIAFDRRRRLGLPFVPPDPSLGYAANFLKMYLGELPEPEVVRCFEISLILYAEHSFNASTFTARVVTSTRSDMYSAVCAAVGALKGSLHGGANEAAMRMLQEVGDPAVAEQWMLEALAQKRTVMGFGHRVYKNGDTRVPVLREALGVLAGLRDAERWMAIYDALERTMLREKGLLPNVDFPTGLAYHLMGIDIDSFTPIFAMARTVGWTAHVMEQASANALIRPLALYTGETQRDLL